MSMHHNKGFTLVEVLIAGVILFTSLGLVYSAFSQSVMNTEKAQKVIELNGSIPLIVSKVKADLNNKLGKTLRQGRGIIGNTYYEWRTHEVKNDPILQYASSDVSTSGNAVKLLEVHITLEVDDTKRTFSFKEVVW